MPGPSPIALSVSSRQRRILEGWRGRREISRRLHQRTSIVLDLADGHGNLTTTERQGVSLSMVQLWRRRWKANLARLNALEAELDDKALARTIAEVLKDAPGRGVKPKFTPEQVAQILKLATTPPSSFGRPISHWSETQLADEAIKQGIVESISPRQVGRFLKRGGVEASPDQVLGDEPGQG